MQCADIDSLFKGALEQVTTCGLCGKASPIEDIFKVLGSACVHGQCSRVTRVGAWEMRAPATLRMCAMPV